MINMDAHGGLRGSAACWIMIFHCILYSKLPMDFQGSSLMPLFFILSGFSLAITYSTGVYDIQNNGNKSSFLKFIVNRFARAGPVYYFGYFLALPLCFFGFNNMSPTDVGGILATAVVSFIQLSTLLCFVLGGSMDGPGWTICTLTFMWLAFPPCLRYFEKKSDEALMQWIGCSYLVQSALVFLIFFPSIPFVQFWIAFSAATMNPLSRFPVFAMGICAGILCKRHSHDPLPWSSFYGILPGWKCCHRSNTKNTHSLMANESPDDSEMELDGVFWSGKVFSQVVKLLSVTLFVWAVDTIQRYGVGGSGILGAVWFQAIVPFAQLELVIALCRDCNNVSVVTKVCKNAWSKWLGDRSMCIYLVHYPLIYYLCWAIHGKALAWPNEWNCEVFEAGSDAKNSCVQTIVDWVDARSIPVWGIPVVVAASLLLAHGVYHVVEVPWRKIIRMQNV